VHVTARAGDVGLQPEQVRVQVSQGVVLDRLGRLAQLLPVGQFGDRAGALARIVCVACVRLARSWESATAILAAAGNDGMPR
jgi:hypothetical protein